MRNLTSYFPGALLFLGLRTRVGHQEKVDESEIFVRYGLVKISPTNLIKPITSKLILIKNCSFGLIMLGGQVEGCLSKVIKIDNQEI